MKKLFLLWPELILIFFGIYFILAGGGYFFFIFSVGLFLSHIFVDFYIDKKNKP